MNNATVRKLSKQDLLDLAEGAAILASGGGGPVNMIEPLIDCILAAGDALLADVSAVGDGDLVTCAYGAGSPSTVQAQPSESAAKLSKACLEAHDAFAKDVGRAVNYTVAIETGVINTLLPFYIAAKRGVPVLDGAGGRRSVPTITLTAFALAEAPFSPMVMGNGADTPITIDVATAAQAEAPMMGIISTPAFSNSSGLSAWQIAGRDVASSIEAGTVSYTMGLGAALRQSRDGGDPVSVVTEYLGGVVLLKGQLTSNSSQTSNSWDFQQILFKESGSDTEVRLYAQNETLIAWNNQHGEPVAMGPDLICYLAQDGTVFSNADLDSIAGKDIAIIGAPATPLFRQEAVVHEFLTLLSALGYGGSYVPLQVAGAPAPSIPMPPHDARRHRLAALKALRRHGRF